MVPISVPESVVPMSVPESVVPMSVPKSVIPMSVPKLVVPMSVSKFRKSAIFLSVQFTPALTFCSRDLRKFVIGVKCCYSHKKKGKTFHSDA